MEPQQVVTLFDDVLWNAGGCRHAEQIPQRSPSMPVLYDTDYPKP